jgi:hypothetical protein
MIILFLQEERTESESSKWIVDSGCSRHMTGKGYLLNSMEYENRGTVKFGNNDRSKIVASGNIENGNLASISNVLLVENLKHNLLSVSQLCDKGYSVNFKKAVCHIIDNESAEVKFVGKRKGDIYMLNFPTD